MLREFTEDLHTHAKYVFIKQDSKVISQSMKKESIKVKDSTVRNVTTKRFWKIPSQNITEQFIKELRIPVNIVIIKQLR